MNLTIPSQKSSVFRSWATTWCDARDPSAHLHVKRALAHYKLVRHVRDGLEFLGLHHNLHHLADLNLDERAPRVLGVAWKVLGADQVGLGTRDVAAVRLLDEEGNHIVAMV